MTLLIDLYLSVVIDVRCIFLRDQRFIVGYNYLVGVYGHPFLFGKKIMAAKPAKWKWTI